MIRRLRSEQGISLAEVLVAMAILGLAVVTILSGYTTALLTAGRHEAAVKADAVSRLVAEAVKGQAYDPCPAGYAVGPALVPYPEGWGPGDVALDIVYWSEDTDRFSGSCPGGGDDGLQRVSILVRAPNGRGERTLQVLKGDH